MKFDQDYDTKLTFFVGFFLQVLDQQTVSNNKFKVNFYKNKLVFFDLACLFEVECAKFLWRKM